MRVPLFMLRWSLRLFFSVTVFLGFIALMFLNLHLSSKVMPGLVDAVGAAGQSKRSSAFIAFLVATPIPVLCCYLWYRLFNWIDQRFDRGLEADS